MQITSSTDSERNLAIELILEDIPGGGVIESDDFKAASTGMAAGALVDIDSDGIWHLTKTAMVLNAVGATGTGGLTLRVYQNHEFKVGDLVTIPANTATGFGITSITASGTVCDVVTLASAINVAIPASGLIIEGATSGFYGGGFRYSPTAIATNTVDLRNENTGCGLMVRGRVRQGELPYVVDSTLKALFPLIRFV